MCLVVWYLLLVLEIGCWISLNSWKFALGWLLVVNCIIVLLVFVLLLWVLFALLFKLLGWFGLCYACCLCLVGYGVCLLDVLFV